MGTSEKGISLVLAWMIGGSAMALGEANMAPVVSNVQASQRQDVSRVVEIHYDLADADDNACTISVLVSSDGGATWALSPTALTGDVGPGIPPGVGKTIAWDCRVDLPGAVGSQFRVRVSADDGHNQPPAVSDPFIAGQLSQGEQGLVEFSCMATDPDGTVESVAADLTAIGGLKNQPLSRRAFDPCDPCNRDRWYGSVLLTPPIAGLQGVTLTATDDRGATDSVQAWIEIAPPGMVPIPGGEFLMGNFVPPEGELNELPLHAVHVDPFFMDRHEVTNRQYADALNWAWAQGGLIKVVKGVVHSDGTETAYPFCDTTASSAYSRITWNGGTFVAIPGKEDHPVVLVSWYGAAAYANWRSGMQGRRLCYDLSTWDGSSADGYRLPTEAEWEKAARGGMTGHRFPWSDADIIQHSRANYYSLGSPYYDAGPTRGYHLLWGVGAQPYTSPIGFFSGALQHGLDWGWPAAEQSYQTSSGANGYGLHDMGGNAFEWCNDWFGSDYYAKSPSDNPRGPASGSFRVLRGGSWGSVALNLRCAYRGNCVPDYRAMTNGFRLVLNRD